MPKTKKPTKKHTALAKKKKQGRPRRIPKERIPVLEQLIKLGYTNKELAEVFGCSKGTICNYKADPDFFQPLKEAGEQAVQRVRESLYQRCLGYTFPSEKVFIDKYTQKPIRVPVNEHVPPDINAAKFYLCNNDPENYTAKDQGQTNVDVNTNVTQVNVDRDVTDDDKRRLQSNLGILERHRLLDMSSS